MPGTPQDRSAPDKAMAVALARASVGSGPDCLDADELAAYYTRSLDAGELAHHETHVASCLACQERLVAMMRSEPEPTAGPSWWAVWLTPPRLAWTTPAMVAVLVAAVWIAGRPGGPPPEPEARLAQGLPETVPAPEVERKTAQSEPLERLEAVPPVGGRAESIPQQRSGAPAAAPPAAPPAERADATARPAGQTKAKEGAVVKRELQVATDEPRPAEEKPPLAGNEAAAGGRARTAVLAERSFAAAPPPLLVTTPGGVVLWRLDAGGAIARSDDSGASWRTQMTTDVVLLAGSAPDDSVCWVVGRSGAVLRTADGETWQRVASPADADLVQIEATDALLAVVIAADGRRFETIDGGQTWTVR